MKYYWLRAAKAPHLTGYLSAAHKWGLPGVRGCPGCGASWGGVGLEYPCVDLSALPEHQEFEEARQEPYDTFVRLRELVRPLAPKDALLEPGTDFGPLVGTATGTFGALYTLTGFTFLARREALEQIQAQGLRGLLGCPTALRFRAKRPPELLELQIDAHGRMHTDCLPPDREPRCSACGRESFTRPEQPLLDAATLPSHLDLFRLAHFPTMVIATERFVEAVQRLSLDGVTFRELPVR